MSRNLILTLAFTSFASIAQANDWPQWLGPKRDGVWSDTGILDKFPAEGPKVLWRKPIPPAIPAPQSPTAGFMSRIASSPRGP